MRSFQVVGSCLDLVDRAAYSFGHANLCFEVDSLPQFLAGEQQTQKPQWPSVNFWWVAPKRARSLNHCGFGKTQNTRIWVVKWSWRYNYHVSFLYISCCASRMESLRNSMTQDAWGCCRRLKSWTLATQNKVGATPPVRYHCWFLAPSGLTLRQFLAFWRAKHPNTNMSILEIAMAVIF